MPPSGIEQGTFRLWVRNSCQTPNFQIIYYPQWDLNSRPPVYKAKTKPLDQQGILTSMTKHCVHTNICDHLLITESWLSNSQDFSKFPKILKSKLFKNAQSALRFDFLFLKYKPICSNDMNPKMVQSGALLEIMVWKVAFYLVKLRDKWKFW